MSANATATNAAAPIAANGSRANATVQSITKRDHLPPQRRRLREHERRSDQRHRNHPEPRYTTKADGAAQALPLRSGGSGTRPQHEVSLPKCRVRRPLSRPGRSGLHRRSPGQYDDGNASVDDHDDRSRRWAVSATIPPQANGFRGEFQHRRDRECRRHHDIKRYPATPWLRPPTITTPSPLPNVQQPRRAYNQTLTAAGGSGTSYV